MSDSSIDVRNLTIRFGASEAISHLSLRIERGEMLAVCGPNGAGKSTLLRCLAGLVSPSEGEIRGLENLRVSYLPQTHQIDRSFPITVMEMVSLGMWHETGAMRRLDYTQQRRCRRALDLVSLSEQQDDPISRLSGGQFQRALFARTVLQDADVVLMDEPFQGVDVRGSAGLINQMRAMQREGKTVIAVLHDHQLALTHFSRIVLLAGQLVASGYPGDVLSDTNIERAYRRSLPAVPLVSEQHSHGGLAATRPILDLP